jgi:hypothetical protein
VSKSPLARATANGHESIGLPWKLRMFFRGIRLLPPLAGMMANDDIAMVLGVSVVLFNRSNN